MHMAPGIFQHFVCQSFVDSLAFWCHPSTCCEDKGIEWRLFYVNNTLVVLILLFFMLLGDLCQGLPRIGLWGSVKESFLTAIPESSRRDFQPCIVSSVDFSFIVIFIDWQMCGFGLNIPAALSHYQCLRMSHWVASHWSVTTHFTWGCDPQSLSIHKHSRWVCLSPSIHISCRWHQWILFV